MRYRSLDSVRGIAATIVVFYHAILTIPGSFEDRLALRANGFDERFAWLYLTPLRILVAGPAAVYLFFVLSGFVLTLSLGGGGRETYATFMLKRIVRIWLPFAVAILISAILASLLAHVSLRDASEWMHQTWTEPVNLILVLKHLAMLGTAISLDNPMWSLIHEVRISFIFPFLVICAEKRPILLIITASAGFVLSIVLQIDHSLSLLIHSHITTLCYLPLFVIGILLALNRRFIFRYFETLRVKIRIAAWILALIGLGYSPVVTSVVDRFNDSILLLVNGMAAAVIIALTVTGHRARHFLEKGPFLWLGKISYSLYLIHVIVFAVLLRLMAGLPLPLLLPLCICVALIVAAIFQRYVEQPAAAAAQLIASRLNRPAYARSKASIAKVHLAND
jgi:peptidoglycan/LPS O-acetylase OafA/YrhL